MPVDSCVIGAAKLRYWCGGDLVYLWNGQPALVAWQPPPIVKPQLAGPELQMSLQNMCGHLLGEVDLSEE